MSKRKRKRRRNNSQPGGTPRKGAGPAANRTAPRPGAGPSAASADAPEAARAPETASVATQESPGGTDTKRTPIVPWRDRVRRLRDQLRAFARNHYAPVLDAALVERFGNPPRAEHPADLERVEEDLVCTPGSAGDARSILRVYADDGAQLEQTPLEDSERAELLRWEQGRSRGVFLVQRAAPDRIEVWDPLEGAGLTLHLLDRLAKARADALSRGSVLTTTFLPFAARVVAVGYLELFEDPRAKELFRQQVRAGGRGWQEAPPPAPKPTR